MSYGMELILDLHECDPVMFTRESIEGYFVRICDAIEMERCELHFWDETGVPEDERQTNPKTIGTSAVQFILTSNVTIHTLDELGAVYVNVFSCKEFDLDVAESITREWFRGRVAHRAEVVRL